ncbi:MAG: tetratricopeptide repeat protein [Proteobacteria bacterium]|nr:tetratricopeptide repeat protein [Pseudomonadota bacterium]
MKRVFTYILLFCLFTGCAPNQNSIKQSKIHYEMGILYFQEGDYVRALQEFVRAKDLNDSDKFVWNALGLAYKERKLLKEAKDAFERAISIDRDYSEAYNNLGVLYLEEGKYKESIRYFEKAVKNIFYTTPELAYNNMGFAYEKLNDQLNAEKNYKEAISINPSFSPAYINLARIYEQQGRYKEAEEVLNKFLTAFENHLEVNFALGSFLVRTGQKDRAKRYLMKVINIDSRSELAKASKKILEEIK